MIRCTWNSFPKQISGNAVGCRYMVFDSIHSIESNKSYRYQQSFHGVDLSSLRQAAMKEYFRQPVVVCCVIETLSFLSPPPPLVFFLLKYLFPSLGHIWHSYLYVKIPKACCRFSGNYWMWSSSNWNSFRISSSVFRNHSWSCLLVRRCLYGISVSTNFFRHLLHTEKHGLHFSHLNHKGRRYGYQQHPQNRWLTGIRFDAYWRRQFSWSKVRFWQAQLFSMQTKGDIKHGHIQIRNWNGMLYLSNWVCFPYYFTDRVMTLRLSFVWQELGRNRLTRWIWKTRISGTRGNRLNHLLAIIPLLLVRIIGIS